MDHNIYSNSSQEKADLRYLIPEDTYYHGHPEVVEWTTKFSSEAEKYEVFKNIHSALQTVDIAKANKVATAWYEFTTFVPTFLSLAVVLTDDPERQHHLIQIAYDELGGQDKQYIHSKLFLEAIEKVNLSYKKDYEIVNIKNILEGLKNTLLNTNSQYGIVGLLLSFEIIAEENIETLFKGLCFDDNCIALLSDTPFFEIHRADETEHIRHSVANFLRFCQSDESKREFMVSFEDGLNFWRKFWNYIAENLNISTK
ncbi:iron-containing redox enzyme family protein [Acinetobacter pittii]|uniref:iron-containing redox enzyme family protein n=1 Tax=Acinetobacter pittii TaxID=48296 RepID=UPI001F05720D|nr:iron-containing redox enzyme family protein [Acinetobacter pittii]MCH2072088.1 iron-containing redox enzyme family protein [Acinetobacter pittii]